MIYQHNKANIREYLTKFGVLIMEQKRLRRTLQDKSTTAVTVELTGTPSFGFEPIEHFLKGYQASNKTLPDGFELAAITVTQNSGGTPGVEPAAVLSHVKANNLLGDLDFIPHLTCKDHNVDGLKSLLMAFKQMDVESILAFTGDKPIRGKGVFEVDSVGLIDLIGDINAQSYMKASLEDLDATHQFYIGAAVSPFKYTEASQMQQYYKMEKKIASGAGFLTTQLGWDWKKSLELFTYLKERNLDVPVIGNVFFLGSGSPAARLIHSLKLPGSFVSDELFAKLKTETVDDNIARAAQQIAMYRAMGAAGVDIGSVHDHDMFLRIMEQAAEIGEDWEQYKDNLYWPAEKTFYLYDDSGKRTKLSTPRRKLSHVNFELFHAAILDEAHFGFHAFRKVTGALGMKKGKGFFYKTFNIAEKAAKYLLFDCEECGDCFLPENFGRCTIGPCEKGLANVPCGDATVDGYCGNDLERVCIGEFVFNAASAKKGGIDKWIETICPPRKHELEGTSSILNYLFARDHTQRGPLISVAESINAFVPKTGKIMKMVHDAGGDGYTTTSGPLNYMRALIESQAREKADYIGVNVDGLGADGDTAAVDAIGQYAAMVRKWARGVPVCIESASAEVLIEGLRQWYNTTGKVQKPMLSIPSVDLFDPLAPLKTDFDFAVAIGLKVAADATPAQLLKDAKDIFATATAAGFTPADIFFNLPVTPLSKDMPEDSPAPSKTYTVLETIKKIKSDPTLKKSHCMLTVSLAAAGMPRRIGVCRAFAAEAVQYGCDA